MDAPRGMPRVHQVEGDPQEACERGLEPRKNEARPSHEGFDQGKPGGFGLSGSGCLVLVLVFAHQGTFKAS